MKKFNVEYLDREGFQTEAEAFILSNGFFVFLVFGENSLAVNAATVRSIQEVERSS